MIQKISLGLVLLLTVVFNIASAQRTVLFDDNWKFFRGNDSLAFESSYDDKQWRKLDLPHDWSIEDLPGTNSPFSADAINPVSVGFTTGGTGWYRKDFTVPAASKNKKTVIQFDGVYMNADVWINGKHLGKHPYGYTSFYYDLTDKLFVGKNTIAVQVKNEGKNSRWYSGSGIYRHVWLTTTAPVHIAQWGTSVTTPIVSTTTATVNIKTKVQNESNKPAAIRLVTRVVDAAGIEKARKESTQSISAGEDFQFDQDAIVNTPKLWSTEKPTLYKTVTQIYENGQLMDQSETKFGIRSISFDAVNGFRLNGKTVKLKGGCVHHDNGALGAKAYDRAEERKVELLKRSGYNAIRSSHNPPSPAFLDACDRLGMLVIDEAFDTWKEKKNREDYNLYFNDWWQRDMESMILRDRNHPSIIMWSTGNEIPNRTKPEVAAVSKELSDFIKSLDTTRAVTCGVNGIDTNPDAFIAPLDVAGYNYAIDRYKADHERLPNRVIMASESFALEAFDYWMAVEDNPYVIGDFVWTSFDYIGEASIGWLGYPQNKNFYPWNLAYCGDIDVCGWKRPQSYYRDALWMKDKVSIFVKPPKPSFDRTNPKPESWSKWNWQDVVADWNWKGYENQPLGIEVYSSSEDVELFLNGKSLGKKPTNRSTRYMGIWQVPYAAGELKAVGYSKGKQQTVSYLRSAAAPVQLQLTADKKIVKANGQDLSYITINLIDKNGTISPKADDLLKFTISGPGTIVGVANANPESIESAQLPQRKAWRGRCQVIVKSGKKAGTITLQAAANGFKTSSISISSK